MPGLFSPIESLLASLAITVAQPCADVGAAEDLVACVAKLDDAVLVVAELAALGPGQQPSPRQQAALGRQVKAAMARLAELSAALQPVLPNSQAAARQLTAACHLAKICATLHTVLKTSLVRQMDAVIALLPATPRDVLSEGGVQGVQQAWEGGAAASVPSAADQQDGQAAASWMGLAAAALCRVPAQNRTKLLSLFVRICQQAIYPMSPGMAAYRQALQQQPSALASLLEALVLVLPAAVAALLQPPGEQQARPIEQSSLSVHEADYLVSILSSDVLRPAIRQLLEAGDSRRTAAAAVLLRASAQLTEHLPQEPAPQLPQSAQRAFEARLLGCVCYLLVETEQARRLTLQQRQHMSRRLLAAVPSLTLVVQQAARFAAGSGPAGQTNRPRQAAGSCEHMAWVLQALRSLLTLGHFSNTAPNPITASLADASAWAQAAFAALRALPAADRLEQQLRGPAVRQQLKALPAALAEAVCSACLTACYLCSGFVYRRWGQESRSPAGAAPAAPPPTAELAAAFQIFFKLHSTVCRWINWTASSPTVAAALWGEGGPAWEQQLGCLRHSYVAAWETWAACSRLMAHPAAAACLQAMHAAHYDTLVVATAAGTPASAWDADAAVAAAAGSGPAGSAAGYAAAAFEFCFDRLLGSGRQPGSAPHTMVLWSPALQACILWSLRHPPKDPAHQLRIWSGILQLCVHSPRMAAAVLTDGGLARILGNAGGILARRQQPTSKVRGALQPWVVCLLDRLAIEAQSIQQGAGPEQQGGISFEPTLTENFKNIWFVPSDGTIAQLEAMYAQLPLPEQLARLQALLPAACTACSHADWRQGGHRFVCKALAAAGMQAKQGPKQL
ncbi:hypothetical protein ABPG75_007711 [Micractinium tetrahymenae]